MNIYDKLYDPEGVDYGNLLTLRDGVDYTDREQELLLEIKHVISEISVGDCSKVLEIGASMGYNHTCHPQYLGIEYSSVAVEMARKRFGYPINVEQGDATKLEFNDSEFDFIFSFATLEHIPDIESALKEIHRVLKGGGKVYLAPAWNCRSWTVEKLSELPYAELTFRKKLSKLLIPLRENIVFRFCIALPKRLVDEFKVVVGSYKLRYHRMEPRFDLIDRYGHVSDDDAFISIDAHAVISFYRSRGCAVLSHPDLISRILCRHEPVLVEK